MIKIFLGLCFFPVLIVIWLMFRNDTKPKKNIILGTTLTKEARADARVAKICRHFRIALGIATLVLALPPIAALVFTDSMSIIFAVLMIWIDVLMFTFMFIYGYYCGKLRRLKAECGWGNSVVGKATVSMNAGLYQPFRGQIVGLVVPVLLSLVPVALSFFPTFRLAEFCGCLSMTVTVVIFWLCFRFCCRNRAEVIDNNEELTAVLTRVRRRAWSKCWYLSCWTTAGFAVFFWASIRWFGELAMLIGTGVYTIVLVAVIMTVEFRVRATQQRLTEDCGAVVESDDDAYWLWGQLYCNPYDRRLIVNNRVGLNTSINVARASGKVILIIALVMMLALPVFGGLMIKYEFTPREISLVDGDVVAWHVSEKYRIPVDKIESAELIDKLPHAVRVMGGDDGKNYSGIFEVEGYGKCKVLTSVGGTPQLVIKSDSETYIFSCENGDVIKGLYADIMEAINENF